jgi:transposase-like protein
METMDRRQRRTFKPEYKAEVVRLVRTSGKSIECKRWRSGEMILRWMLAAISETANGFRHLKGSAGMPLLVARLRANDDLLNNGTNHITNAA